MDQPSIRVHDLWSHQLEAYAHCEQHPAAYIAAAMGTGKSAVVVAQVVNHGLARTLILCPVSVLGVWRREFQRHAPHDRCPEVLVLDKGTTVQKAGAVERAVSAIHPSSLQPSASSLRPSLVVVVNYESAWRNELAAVLLAGRWDLVVLDEAHRCKAPSGRISRFVARLRGVAVRRLCLSGTPAPHSPLDLFSQFRFLDPSIFGLWYTQFRARYAVTDRMFPSRVLRWVNQKELSLKFRSITYQVGSEVLDLPPEQHQTLSFALCSKAWRVYAGLRDELIAEVGAGLVTAGNALVKLLRLQQLTGGGLVSSDGVYVQLDGGKESLLLDLVRDIPAGEPVVVFCRFVRDLAAVERVAGVLGRRYGEVSGRRHDLTEHAAMQSGVDMMGVQVQSGSLGVDLTAACYCVHYSLGFSLGEYQQSLARVNRPGQTRPVRYYHLVAERTVDELVYKALAARKKVVEAVLTGLAGAAVGEIEENAWT